MESNKDIENKAIGYNYQAIAFQDLREYEKSENALQLAFELLKDSDSKCPC